MNTDQSFAVVTTADDLLEEFLLKCVQSAESGSGNDVDRVIRKIRKRFMEVNLSYRKSDFFADYVRKLMRTVTTEPWYSMKELYDTLGHHAVEKSLKLRVENPTSAKPAIRDDSVDLIDRETQKKIEKLETKLLELKSRIKMLEESEIDLDKSDDENSNYIKLDRYKKRFCEVYNRIRKLKRITTGDTTSRGIQFSGTKIFSINRAIERYYNEKKQFPDFLDIFNVVKLENEKTKLGLSKSEIHETARVAFKELGRFIKLRREYELHGTIYSFLSDDEAVDPAEKDEKLQNKLEENERIHAHKIDKLVNDYAARQAKERSKPVNADDIDEEFTMVCKKRKK